MLVSEIGEFGLIDRITRLINKNGVKSSNLLVGIGDDAAAWRPSGQLELATTDILVEGVHFDLAHTGWKDLGCKALAINISDISAMGGRPEYALVSLALLGTCSVNDVLDLYSGMLEIANKYGVTIAGGNISSSDRVIINIVLTGTAESLMRRSSASPGDLVAMFGHPGLAAAGLQLLKSKKRMAAKDKSLLISAHLRPDTGFDTGPKLAAAGVKTAIDLSDGLAADLRHICESSRVSATIYTASLPLHPLLKKHFPETCIKLALSGGEDYLLLFTAASPLMNKIMRTFKPAPTVIGETTAGSPGKVRIVDEKGRQVRLNYTGWEHYRRHD